MRHFRNRLALSLAVALITGFLPGIARPDDLSGRELLRGFRRPPDSARPWVYWFWLNGNITSNGITADLEAMKRVGIGGVLIMEVDQGAPVGPVDFMSDRWRGLFRHVHREAKRLGLEVNMNNDAGWNGSGGPWIRPEQSMQKAVWSETNVVGPLRLDLRLPRPEAVAGYYRDITVLAFPAVGAHRIEGIRGKAAFDVAGGSSIERGPVPNDAVIARDRIREYRASEGEGRVTGELPAGTWTLMRFGHTSTGVENAPAPKSGRGLECDKLDASGIEAQFEAMMTKLATDNGLKPPTWGRFPRTGLVATHIDSWENGSQNWTGRMREEFRSRRGYDLWPFLPVFSGRIVDSLEVSTRFLRDLRQTISEMVIENYAGRMHQLARGRGMRFTVEAYGSPCDSIPYAGRSDEPMGEFWTPSGAIETCRAMASAGHVYGKRIIGAEAFTSGDQERWREHPAVLKAHGDRAFCEGINRFVFHRYALQPWTEPARVPGMTMGPWGQHYERTQTWWDWTPAWHEYLARCQFLLRQGRFVADLCYLQPELPPQGPGDHPRDGYPWDECTAEAVIERMTVRDGRIVLSDGMSYRLLVLPDVPSMTPELLRRLMGLVEAGATLLGPKPSFSPSLTGYPDCDAEVRRMAAELWGEGADAEARERHFGKGRVLRGATPAQALKATGVPPDFVAGQPLNFIHRRTETADLYFVANPRPVPVTTTCSFRVEGRRPELWWPTTGRTETAPMYASDAGRTHVVLGLEAHDSVFVVFRQPIGDDDPIVELKRDGVPVLAARPEPPPVVTVIRARYGIPEDEGRTRDVTAAVQRKADGAETVFVVGSLAAEGDPAPLETKTLVVDYRIGGKEFTVKARDPERIRLADDVLRASVRQARYGVPGDPVRTRDVRERVQRLIDAGETGFTVARMAEGDDPAFLVVKTLELEYSVDGETRRVSGQDPDLLELVPPRSMPRPAADVRRTGRWRIVLEPRESGTYSWVTASGRTAIREVSAGPVERAPTGAWEVSFGGEVGRPGSRRFDRLISWSEADDPAVRYHSGTATYRRTVTVPPEMRRAGGRLELDLGRVEVMARVRVRGRLVATLWRPPFVVDLTDRVGAGDVDLEIEVVNLLPNRMIGDEQLPEDADRNPDGTLKRWPDWVEQGGTSPTGRRTFTSWRLWKATDTPLRSGLLGPVVWRWVAVVPADGSAGRP